MSSREKSPEMSSTNKNRVVPQQSGDSPKAATANKTGEAAADVPNGTRPSQATQRPKGGARRRKQSKPVADMSIDERRREAKRFGRWAAKHERQAKALRAKERKLLEGEDPGVAKDVKPNGAAADAPVPPVSDATSTPESGREEQQACLKEEGEKVDVVEEKVDI